MKKVISSTLFLFVSLIGWANPSLRTPFRALLTNGKEIQVVKQGDEYFHYYTTTDGKLLNLTDKGFEFASEPQKKALESAARRASKMREKIHERRKTSEVPKKGKVKLLVLLAEFKDTRFTYTQQDFDQLTNGREGSPEDGTASVWQYFQDQSDGLFNPQFSVCGPYTLGKDMAYYGGNEGERTDVHASDMIAEVCRLADGDVDFSEYDSDGDGILDLVFVIYAGYGESANTSRLADTVWPHHSYLSSNLVLDGTKVESYACSCELSGYSGTTRHGIGTFCHEFSHCLGLPDFYDTQGDNFGMGSWDLMDYGGYNNSGYTPCGYTSYERDFMGWRSVNELKSTAEVSMTALTSGGEGYKIVNDENSDEYYLLENRQQVGWDRYCASHGMLILHVDYQPRLWTMNQVNTSATHPRMTIIPADNRRDTGTVTGDTYPGSTGNTALTDNTKPAAEVYTGGYMGKSVTDIAEEDGIVTFIYEKGALPIPENLPATDVHDTGFTAHWHSVEGTDSFCVTVSHVTESPYILEENFDAITEGTSDISTSLNSYTIQRGWNGANIYGQDGYITIGRKDEMGYLISPNFEADSVYTIMLAIKKHHPSDATVGCVIAVGDDTWGNSMYGYLENVKNDEWITFVMEMDTIGPSTWLYIDTRNGGKRVDVDNIFIIPGHYSSDDEPASAPSMQVSHPVQRVSAQRLSAGPTAQRARAVSSSLFSVISTDTCFLFSGLPAGQYAYKVHSILNGRYSKPSGVQSVTIVDNASETTSEVLYRMENGALQLYSNDSPCAYYYTLNGTLPTAYAGHYTSPIPLDGPVVIRAVAKAPGKRFSDVVTISNFFTHGGACYQWVSTTDSTVAITHHKGGNRKKDYSGDYVIADDVEYEGRSCPIVGIGEKAFAHAPSLRSVVVKGKGIQSVGDSLFWGCSDLKAVAWDIATPLPADAFGMGYTNLIVYIPEGMDSPRTTDIILVKGGKAERVVLDYNAPFYNLRDFTSSEISFSRVFSQATYLGESAGWETIALPFDVQQIATSDGEIAPFASPSGMGLRHFWLAEMGPDGFRDAVSMKANVPYILSMPNHSEYGDNSVSGVVTFTARQATVKATTDVLPAEGIRWALMPTYERVTADDALYALNVGAAYEAYKPGSIFVAGMYDVAPFSSYAVPLQANAPRLFPVRERSEEPSASETVCREKLLVTDHRLTLSLEAGCGVSIYDAVGHLLLRKTADTTSRLATVNVPNGLYFIIKNQN